MELEQLCSNITHTYSLTFPNDSPIKAEQVKFNDYVIPPQYKVGEVFSNESEITVQSHQLGRIAEKFSTSMVTQTIPIAYPQEELPDTPKVTPIEGDHENKLEQNLLIKEIQKKIRKLSESKEVEVPAKKRKQAQEELPVPVKKKKVDTSKAFSEALNEPLENPKYDSEDTIIEPIPQATKAPLKPKPETKKEQRGKKQEQSEEVINVEEQEVPRRGLRVAKEQKKVTKPKRTTQRKSIKESEMNKQVKKIISSNKKFYKNPI